ncbi:MAG TPA: GNAT family N-acetyltransferase [Pedobacter sp.]
MKIREFHEDDRQVLRQLYLSSRTETFSWLDTSAYTLSDFDTATAGEYILVAEEEGLPVGFIAAWKSESFIHHLYVDSGHHKKGIGKALLNAVAGVLDQPVRLKCLVENKNALAFYKSMGWQFEMAGSDVTGRYYLLRNDILNPGIL